MMHGATLARRLRPRKPAQLPGQTAPGLAGVSGEAPRSVGRLRFLLVLPSEQLLPLAPPRGVVLPVLLAIVGVELAEDRVFRWLRLQAQT